MISRRRVSAKGANSRRMSRAAMRHALPDGAPRSDSPCMWEDELQFVYSKQKAGALDHVMYVIKL